MCFLSFVCLAATTPTLDKIVYFKQRFHSLLLNQVFCPKWVWLLAYHPSGPDRNKFICWTVVFTYLSYLYKQTLQQNLDLHAAIFITCLRLVNNNFEMQKPPQPPRNTMATESNTVTGVEIRIDNCLDNFLSIASFGQPQPRVGQPFSDTNFFSTYCTQTWEITMALLYSSCLAIQLK